MILNEIDEADYPDNTQIPEEKEVLKEVEIGSIYGMMDLTKNAEFVVSLDFFKQIALGKTGTEELVVRGSNCNIYYDYKDTGIELIFEGKYKNRIRITEEDIDEMVLEKLHYESKYYSFKAPIRVGEVLEYIKPLSTNDTTYTTLEQLKINDDGVNVKYSSHVLENIVLHEPHGLTRTWTLIMTDSEEIPEITGEKQIFKDNSFYVNHYADGSIKSGYSTGKNTWVINNDVTSLSTLYKEIGDIKYYALDELMSYKYVELDFKPDVEFFTYEKDLNSKFFKQCCYALLELEYTDLKHPTL
jgi:hypothetical protein